MITPQTPVEVKPSKRFGRRSNHEATTACVNDVGQAEKER
jgi:hypothetical protein